VRTRLGGSRLPCRGQEAPQRALKEVCPRCRPLSTESPPEIPPYQRSRENNCSGRSISGGSVLRTDATRKRYSLAPRARNWDTTFFTAPGGVGEILRRPHPVAKPSGSCPARQKLRAGARVPYSPARGVRCVARGRRGRRTRPLLPRIRINPDFFPLSASKRYRSPRNPARRGGLRG